MTAGEGVTIGMETQGVAPPARREVDNGVCPPLDRGDCNPTCKGSMKIREANKPWQHLNAMDMHLITLDYALDSNGQHLIALDNTWQELTTLECT
jgi:hypothetical protein